jgi:cbb3-type cytochrome oxidase subunit 3
VPAAEISVPQQGERIDSGHASSETATESNQDLVTAPSPDAGGEPADSAAESVGEDQAGKKKASLLNPHYDEATLLAMSAIFVILCVADSTMRADLHKLYPSHSDAGDRLAVLLLLLVFVGGIGFSVFHAFSKRNKSFPEKAAMLFFAVFVSGGIGLYAGNYMIQHSEGCWLLIFAVWNVIYSGLLLIKFALMFRTGPIDVSYVSDRNASPAQVLLALIAVVVIFICCRYWFGLHWAITFSICIAYTTSLDRAVRRVLGRP